MKKLSIALSIAAASILMTACVGPLVEVVHPDKETQKNLISVSVYRVGSQPARAFAIVGDAAAHSCKNKIWDPAASAEDAIGQLKFKAAGANADAVVNIVCAEEGTTLSKNCWEAVTCKGTLVKWNDAASQSPQAPTAPMPKARESSGSGFLINESGQVLTNQHVVENCKNISIVSQSSEFPASLIAEDEINDLAVIQSPSLSRFGYLKFRNSSARLAEPVVAIGYPLFGLLSASVGVSTGSISSLSGIGSDSRMVQISAPVQPGNSGGPLIDGRGAVLGVVASKLNATKIAKVTGDIPQNVNFAISLRTVQNFLDSRSITFHYGDMNANSLSNAAESTSPSVFRIRCF